jgi:hypothetical protein
MHANLHNVLQNRLQWLQMLVIQTTSVACAHVCCSTLLPHHPCSKVACSATQQGVTAAVKLHACMQPCMPKLCRDVQSRVQRILLGQRENRRACICMIVHEIRTERESESLYMHDSACMTDTYSVAYSTTNRKGYPGTGLVPKEASCQKGGLVPKRRPCAIKE